MNGYDKGIDANLERAKKLGLVQLDKKLKNSNVLESILTGTKIAANQIVAPAVAGVKNTGFSVKTLLDNIRKYLLNPKNRDVIDLGSGLFATLGDTFVVAFQNFLAKGFAKFLKGQKKK